MINKKRFMLVDEEQFLDCIHNIELELQQPKIDNNFIQLELNIMKDLINSQYDEMGKLTNKKHYEQLSGKPPLQVLHLYFDLLKDIIGCEYNDVSRKIRKQEYVKCRNIFYYITYNSLNDVISLKHIGMFMGGRDHTTVIHGINNTLRELEINSESYMHIVINCIKVLKDNNMKINDLEYITKLTIAKNKKIIRNER